MVSGVFDDSADDYLASIRASEMDERKRGDNSPWMSDLVRPPRLLKTRAGAPICKSMDEKERQND